VAFRRGGEEGTGRGHPRSDERKKMEGEGEKEEEDAKRRSARKDRGRSPSTGKPTIYGSVATSVFTRRDALPPTLEKSDARAPPCATGSHITAVFHILLVRGTRNNRDK